MIAETKQIRMTTTAAATQDTILEIITSASATEYLLWSFRSMTSWSLEFGSSQIVLTKDFTIHLFFPTLYLVSCRVPLMMLKV
jgi:hypothetical protein